MPTTSQLPECLREFHAVSLPTGTPVFQIGDPCTNFYFVINGSIRVDLITAEGKKVLLYLIGPSETCILSTSCLISDHSYCAEAVTETEVDAIAIPRSNFQELMHNSQPFREIVFRSFSYRLSAMMHKIDEISFASLNKKLARRLLELRTKAENIEVTHEQLANDVGSAREVVSRKLVEWEKQGLIARSRGSVRLTAESDLKKIADLSD